MKPPVDFQCGIPDFEENTFGVCLIFYFFFNHYYWLMSVIIIPVFRIQLF